MGHDGTYIRKKTGEYGGVYAVEPYERQPTCDYSLFELVAQLLPISNAREGLADFILKHSLAEYGLVNQALAEAVDILMGPFRLLVLQLDSEFRKGALSLHKLKHYLQ